MNAPEPAVVDTWYSKLSGAIHPHVALRHMPVLGRLSERLRARVLAIPVLRGVVMFLASVRRPAVGMAREDPGWGTLLFLRALLGRHRKLLGFQYIVHLRSHPLGPVLDAVDRWAVRRALVRAHVLTRSEVETISAHYRLPRERFVYVPWPLATEPLGDLPDLPNRPLVLCSGRAYCDWPTLFAAAEGAGWPLVVVCGRRDRELVEQLNRDAGSPADVRCEIAREDFAEIMRRATVSVVAMVERRRSQGQVRVGDAAVAGVPVVATATVGLDGYVVDGLSGLLVAPGDPEALREAVDRVLRDRALAERLRRGARDRAARYGANEYFAALESFLRDEPVRLPPGAPGASAPS